ncbi:hypothetical protein ABIE67_008938 [Streptomyces sp. V4I8]|uniref:hypothetical protein n=1 Tax=Streptomyces sp. V4I8 TaxID=3156469 RepID=UPI0035138AE3
MPAKYVRLPAHAWGDPAPARTSLLGEIFAPDQPHALGTVPEPTPAGAVAAPAANSPTGPGGCRSRTPPNSCRPG